MTLRDLQMGESAVITTVGGRGALRQHFLDIEDIHQHQALQHRQ